MTNLEPTPNETLPKSAPGGVIESIKTAVVLALREELLGSTIRTGDLKIKSVDLEYPLVKEKYPGIWVGFTLTEPIQKAGIAHELMIKDETDPNWTKWEPVQEAFLKGRVTLTIVALSSLERDRLADYLISHLMFLRPPSTVLTNPSKDIQQNRSLLRSLSENPYVSIGINSDVLTPGGQSNQVGTPWSETILVYEDSYSFDVFGQFNIVFKNDGTYTLRRIDTVAEDWNPYEFH